MIESVGDALVFPTSEPVGVIAIEVEAGDPVWQVVADRGRMAGWTVDRALGETPTAVMVVGD